MTDKTTAVDDARDGLPTVTTRIISLPQKLDDLAAQVQEHEDLSMELSFLAEVARALEKQSDHAQANADHYDALQEIGIVHLYTSTACLHLKHGECRKKCKFCVALCGCACHGATSPASALQNPPKGD